MGQLLPGRFYFNGSYYWLFQQTGPRNHQTWLTSDALNHEVCCGEWVGLYLNVFVGHMPVIIKFSIMISLKFQDFVQRIGQKGAIEEAIRKAELTYSLETYKIGQITCGQAIKIHSSIYTKFYKSPNQLTSTHWYENQLRIFVWAVVGYTFLHDTTIQKLGNQDWAFFSSIFDQKDVKLFEYQCQALYRTANNKHWLESEDKLLTTIIHNEGDTIKWNQISKLLFHSSGKKYFKTAKQCRERWNNHLDPSKTKGYWKAEECLLMFNFVKENGKKWATLVRLLNHTRNEHSVKNKYNSIVKRFRKISKQTDEPFICDQIINRIRHSMANKSRLENEDASFDFEDFQDQAAKVGYKSEGVFDDCHQVTQNFFKLLQNYHSSQQEDKETVRTEAIYPYSPVVSQAVALSEPQPHIFRHQSPSSGAHVNTSHLYVYQQPQNHSQNLNLNRSHIILGQYYQNGPLSFPALNLYK